MKKKKVQSKKQLNVSGENKLIRQGLFFRIGELFKLVIEKIDSFSFKLFR